MFTWFVVSALVATSFVAAQHDTSTPLDKPILVDNLDYLRDGLIANLPTADYTSDMWEAGMIPTDCKHVAEGGVFDSVVYSPADFEIYNVTYSDCGDPWVFCHHKDSNITIDSMASQFSKVPIQMRQWIRHVVDVPADNGWAFEWDGVITFIRPVDDMLTAILHETGHSLDLNGAYADNPLSPSDTFYNAYEADTNVPDTYASSNLVEDVAQNTVVAAFDQNIDGGYPSIEPNWQGIQNQYNVLVNEAQDAGLGNSLLVPGQNQTCSQRLPPSEAVPVDSVSTSTMKDAHGGNLLAAQGSKPDPSFLRSGVKIIDTSNRKNKHSGCKLSW